jgi:DnaJ-like protein
MDADAIRQWLDALDEISYYDLLRVAQDASHDDIRRAFHTFAESFHPDVHRWREPSEQSAIGVIYRRGTEAYRVLCEPPLRTRYDEALMKGNLRPDELITEMDAVTGSGRPVDKLRSPAARQFVLRADELLRIGDPRQAKIQLVMAMHIDQGNPALEQYARDLDVAIAAKIEEERQSLDDD